MTTAFIKSPNNPLDIIEVTILNETPSTYLINHSGKIRQVLKKSVYETKEQALATLIDTLECEVDYLASELEEIQESLQEKETRLVCYKNQLTLLTNNLLTPTMG